MAPAIPTIGTTRAKYRGIPPLNEGQAIITRPAIQEMRKVSETVSLVLEHSMGGRWHPRRGLLSVGCDDVAD